MLADAKTSPQDTAHRNHAHKVVTEMSLDVDCIVTVSGDGLIHECLNGLAVRHDKDKALQTPLAPIPAGSANAQCVNLLGIGVRTSSDQICKSERTHLLIRNLST